MGRAPCCDKANVKKGPWSPEEDAKLKDYIHKHGTGGNWIALPQKVGLRRCGKSCRLRWLNYLRPNIKHGEFSDDEDRIICTLFASIGSRWSIIAAQLPGRTDNDIKNYWNTKLKKKLIINIPPTNIPINNNINNNNHKMMTRPHQPTMFPSTPNHSPFLYPPPPPLNSSSPYQQYYHHHNHSPNFTSLISPDSIGGGPDGLVGPARGGFDNNINNNDRDDDDLLVFGGEHHQDQDLRCYLRNNHIDDENHKLLFSGSSNGYCSSAASAGAEGPISGCSSLMSEAPVLDYSIEEIKQLISTHSSISNNNNNFNFFVDDCTIKTEQGN